MSRSRKENKNNARDVEDFDADMGSDAYSSGSEYLYAEPQEESASCCCACTSKVPVEEMSPAFLVVYKASNIVSIVFGILISFGGFLALAVTLSCSLDAILQGFEDCLVCDHYWKPCLSKGEFQFLWFVTIAILLLGLCPLVVGVKRFQKAKREEKARKDNGQAYESAYESYTEPENDIEQQIQVPTAITGTTNGNNTMLNYGTVHHAGSEAPKQVQPVQQVKHVGHNEVNALAAPAAPVAPVAAAPSIAAPSPLVVPSQRDNSRTERSLSSGSTAGFGNQD